MRININMIITIMLFVSMLSCKTSIPIPQYVGVYQISLTKSNLGEYEYIDSIRDLQLIIKDDSSFEFSRDVPFIYSKSGTWRLEYTAPIDLPPFYKCIFDFEGSRRRHILRPMAISRDEKVIIECYFNGPVSKDDYKQVELLQFTRIK